VLLKHNVVTGATMAFRRRFLGLVTPIPPSWIHDGWIALLISAVARLDCLDEHLVKYRQHSRNQVGARKEGLVEQIDSARNLPRSGYRRIVEQYEAALDRISSLPETDRRRDLISWVQGKIDHQATRWRMPRNPVLRGTWVVRELASGRYHRYASGYRSALKDLANL
jgi:hypothetical protein